MKITFVVQTSKPQIHLIQADTKFIDRSIPNTANLAVSPTRFSHEEEWARFLDQRPDVKAQMNWNDNEYDTPMLIGILPGAVKWLPDPEQDFFVTKKKGKQNDS